jgi:hypothetical protein
MMMALRVSSFAGVHRINTTEINQAGPAVGSAYRRLNAILDKVGSGTVPADSLKEANDLVENLIDARHAALTQGARMVVANAGLDPKQAMVMGRDGTLDTLANVSTAKAKQGGQAGGFDWSKMPEHK